MDRSFVDPRRRPGLGLGALGGALLLAVGCTASMGEGPEAPPLDSTSEAIASDALTFGTLDFDGEVEPEGANDNPVALAFPQLQYLVGTLAAFGGNVQLPRLEVTHASWSGSRTLRYHARVPMTWRKSLGALPPSLSFSLPRRVRDITSGLFVQRYGMQCAGHDGVPAPAAYWAFFNSLARFCTLSPQDVVPIQATVAPHAAITTGRLPEYDAFWNDGVFRAVALFAKDRPGAMDAEDKGIADRNRFVSRLRSLYPQTQVNPGLPNPNPNGTVREIHLEGDAIRATSGTLSYPFVVDILLVDDPASVEPWWGQRLANLTRNADLMHYAGHSGFGANVRSLLPLASPNPGQYQIWFFDACDSFAFVDDRFWERARQIHGDPHGTKYLDVMANGSAAPFGTLNASVLFSSLLRGRHPQARFTFEEILQRLDRSQGALVMGEDDNPSR